MGITTLLLVATVLVTMANGDNFGYDQMPGISFMPALPLPQIPGFPHLQAPPLPVITFNKPGRNTFNSFNNFNNFNNKPFKNFHNFAHVSSFPNFATVQNTVPQNGQQYHGVFVSSASNGLGQGTSQILVNHNGETYHETCVEVTVIKSAPNPKYGTHPFKSITLVTPTIKNRGPFDDFPGFGKFKFPKFDFKMPEIKPLNLDKLKSYMPEKGENFKFSSKGYQVSSVIVDGVEKSDGSVYSTTGDNGDIKELVGQFSKGN